MRRADGIGHRLATATGLFFQRKLRATLRQPVWVVAGLTTPLLYLALFAPLLDSLSGELAGARGFANGVVDGFMPGMLVLFAYGCGTGVGWEVADELASGLVERFRVTPAPRFAMLAGSALRDMAMFLVPAAPVIGVAALFGFDIHPWGLVAALVLLGLLAVAVSAVCQALGLVLKDIGSLAAVVTGAQLPLMLLSGVLLPISLGPAWLRALAHADPLYYATEAARELCGGDFGRAAALGFAVIGCLTAVALLWATRVYRRAVA